jgi:hypothetical protein
MGTGSVTSDAILDGTIVNGDINASAAIDATKISGTAAVLNGNQIFTGINTIDANAYLKASRTLSLGDTTSGASMLLVPFAFSGTVNANDVVVLDTTASNTVKTTTTAKDPNIIGFAQRIEGTTAYVAVAGRITTAVANQAISVGDVICTSATAGRVNGYTAMQTGKMIGVAVTSAASAGNSVSVLIQRF